MKRLLQSLVLLATWCGLSFGQSALIEVPLLVNDGVGTRTLYFGLDPNATDGVDAALGESERPPIPPAGVLDARFIGSEIGISIGQGLAKDCREGDLNTTGVRIHELQYQVGSGTSITISWNFPSWATGRLQDLLTGSIIDVQMIGSDSTQITNPGILNKLKMSITYTAPLPVQLVSFAARPTGSGRVQLDWATESEVNNLGFHLHRRLSRGAPFIAVSETLIPGHGTTIVPQYYSYTDSVGLAGEYEYRLEQVDLDGTVHYPVPIKIELSKSLLAEEKPTEFTIFPNYPNPFNPSTTIRYGLSQKSDVQLRIFNTLGQQVAVLVEGEQEVGYHEVKFDATGLSSGVYFYRLQAGDYVATQELLLLR